jgi:hypothetical protein
VGFDPTDTLAGRVGSAASTTRGGGVVRGA